MPYTSGMFLGCSVLVQMGSILLLITHHLKLGDNTLAMTMSVK